MDVHAVIGAAGAGTTATALNLAVALRRAEDHAAVLDLTGDVASLCGLDTGGVESLGAGGSVAEATVRVPLRVDGLGGAIREYYEASRRDETAFREGRAGSDGAVPPDPNDGSGRDLPLIVGGGPGALADATPERRESLRADLAFAYDHVIVDAGTPAEGAVALADGHLVVTAPDDDAVEAARRTVVSCLGADGLVVGVVVNRATADTDVSAIRDRLRTDVVGVIPEDARTPALEPVAHTAPEAPAATAYGRLAGAVADWSGEPGLVDGGPEPEPELELAADGDDSAGAARRTVDEPADGDRDRDHGSGGHPFDADPTPDHEDEDKDEDGDGDGDEGGLLSRFF